jgi:hypothetical protein
MVSKRAVVALLIAAACGCSDYKPTYGEVEGTVTLDGKPAAGVEVTFFPVQEQAQGLPVARGTTDSDGKFTLATLDGKKGAIAGPNRVVVNWPSRERGSDREEPQKRPPFIIPLRYTAAADTPLLVEVQPGGPQTIDLELER